MIDFTKPVQTRDGRRVQIFSHDGGTAYPILGAVESPAAQGRPGHWNLQRWTPEGRFHADTPQPINDLVNTPRHIQRTVWVNVFSEYVGQGWGSKDDADRLGGGAAGRLACIPIQIDCQEGEGL